MFTVIGIMFLGVGIGYLMRNLRFLQKINISISGTIFLLLFLLGVSVGTNQQVLNNLSSLGIQALLLAVAATLGSVIAAWGVYHFFFRERRNDEG